MTREETLEFMAKIKAHYQEFSTEDYVVKEWYKKLKPFDIEDVEKRFENHLNSEYQKNIPRLNFIVKGLKTPKQKLKAEDIRVRCQHCGKVLNLQQYDNHMARHNSIFYIKSREHYLGQNYNEEKMLNAYQVHFDKFYDNFLNELYVAMPDNEDCREERERLEKIIFVR